MAYGDGPDDEVLRAAWHAFCERLRAAGDLVFKDVNPPSGIQRANGFQYLTQNLAQAFDLALETKDTAYPLLHDFCGPARKLGSDNGDAIYLQAWIDGQSIYRMSGNRGSARFLSVTVQGKRPETGALHEPFGDSPQASVLGTELTTDADGNFELFIGGDKRGPNWLPTALDSRKLFIRQFFDRWEERPAQLRIENVGMTEPPAPPSPQCLIDAMAWASTFVHDVVEYWPEHVWSGGGLCNPDALNRFDGRSYRRAQESTAEPRGDPQELRRGRVLTQMRWALEPDDALIVSFDDLDSFWMFTNEAIFGNSMDYRYRPVTATPSKVAVDSDGRVRLVLAHRDPGWHNWIDTSGFSAGVLTFRNVLDPRLPRLDTERVLHDELLAALPTDGRFVGGDERRMQLLERFRGVQRRFPK